MENGLVVLEDKIKMIKLLTQAYETASFGRILFSSYGKRFSVSSYAVVDTKHPGTYLELSVNLNV